MYFEISDLWGRDAISRYLGKHIRNDLMQENVPAPTQCEWGGENGVIPTVIIALFKLKIKISMNNLSPWANNLKIIA